MSLPLSCSGLIVYSLSFAMILPLFACQIMPCSQDDQEKTVVVEEGGTASLTLCLKSQRPYQLSPYTEVEPVSYATPNKRYLLKGNRSGKISVDWNICLNGINGCETTVQVDFKDLVKSDLNQTVTLTFLELRKGTNQQLKTVYEHPVHVRLHLQDRKVSAVMPCSQDDEEKTVVVEKRVTAILCLKSLGPFELSERVGVEPVSYANPGKTYLLKGQDEKAKMRVNWSKSKCPDETPHCVNVLFGFKNLVKTDQDQTVTLTFYEKRGGKIVYENPVHVRLHLQEGKGPQHLEESVEQHKVYNTDLNETLTFTVSIYGYPEPLTVQVTGLSKALGPAEVKVNYVEDEFPHGTVYITFARLEEKHFQNYTLNVTNTVGSLIYPFQIQKSKTEGDDSPTCAVDIVPIVGGVIAAVVLVVVGAVIIIFLVRRKAPQRGCTESPDKDVHLRRMSPETRTKEIPDETNQLGVQYEEISAISQPYQNNCQFRAVSTTQTETANPKVIYENSL